MMDVRAKEQRVCDCGLCFFCDGFSATSWASKFDSYFDVLEEEEEKGDPKDSSGSDTSSVVDPQLAEELERLLNEPSECSDLSDSEDELEERLAEASNADWNDGRWKNRSNICPVNWEP